MHQVLAKIGCDQAGILTLESHHEVLQRHMTMIANGIVNNVPNQTFQECFTNVRNHMVILPKSTVV